jgi:hypothetical protein
VRAASSSKRRRGNNGIRLFAIEQNLLPLLRAMHDEAGGTGFVINLRLQKWWAPICASTPCRGHHARRAFRNSATRKRLRCHDLGSTRLTWMAIRGDDRSRFSSAPVTRRSR